MKKSLLTMAAALALVSCSQDQLMPGNPEVSTKGQVGANIFVPTTSRGTALNSVDDFKASGKGFDLFAYSYVYSTDENPDPATEFMGNASDGIKFKYDGNAGGWDYDDRSEMIFWKNVPEGTSYLNFYAVSPALDELTENETANTYSIGSSSENLAQTITYKVPQSVANHLDLMYAQTEVTDWSSTSEAYLNGVPLNFHHALSQIVFKARIDDEDAEEDDVADYVTAEISSISVKNVTGEGQFDMARASSILANNHIDYDGGLADYTDYDYTLWQAYGSIDAVYTVSSDNNELAATQINTISAVTLTDGDMDENGASTNTAMFLIPQDIYPLDLSAIGENVHSAKSEQLTAANISLVATEGAGAYFEVSCKVKFNGKNSEQYIVGDESSFENIYIPITTDAWNPGYKYIYTLVFSANSGDPVKADVKTVDVWNSVEEGDGNDNGSDEGDDEGNVEQLLLNSNSLLMTPNDTYQLSATTSTELAALYTRSGSLNVTYRSTDENIATVTPEGLVTAGSQGNQSCQIIAECNGLTAYCNINIAPDFRDVVLTNKIETANIPAADVVWQMGDGSSEDNPTHYVKLSNDYYISRREISINQFVEFLNAHKDYFIREYYEENEFMVGTSEEDEEVDYVEPAHYRIRFEAGETNYEFCKEHVNGLEYTEGNGWTIKDGYENRPAIVTWEGAAMFAKCVGGELPTEAQWEYAARAGNTDINDGYWFDQEQLFSSEASMAGYEQLLETEAKTQFEDDALARTFRVVSGEGATTQCNAWGLYDLYGNIRELCANVDYAYPVGTSYDNPAVDPKGEFSTENTHMVRGGDYTNVYHDPVSHFSRSFEYSPENLDGFRVIFYTDRLSNMNQTKTNTIN